MGETCTAVVSGSRCAPKPFECYIAAVPCWKRGYMGTPAWFDPMGQRGKGRGSQKVLLWFWERVRLSSHVLSLFTQLNHLEIISFLNVY